MSDDTLSTSPSSSHLQPQNAHAQASSYSGCRVCVLDYGSGNIRSVFNLLHRMKLPFVTANTPEDIEAAGLLILPGMGAMQSPLEGLKRKGLLDVLKRHIEGGKPYLGICVGLQCLFNSSEESPGVRGLGIVDATLRYLPTSHSVPHIGWNTVKRHSTSFFLTEEEEKKSERYYFSHSYCVPLSDIEDKSWVLGTTFYGGVEFVSVLQKGNVLATQFHPEKSGEAGASLISRFIAQYIPRDMKDFLKMSIPYNGCEILCMWQGILRDISEALGGLKEAASEDSRGIMKPMIAAVDEAAHTWLLSLTDSSSGLLALSNLKLGEGKELACVLDTVIRLVEMIEGGNTQGLEVLGAESKKLHSSLKKAASITKSLKDEDEEILKQKTFPGAGLGKRIVACLDVRENNGGELIVTKGDQYDVKEGGRVRDFGSPVDLARRYYIDGADEILFLSILSFRKLPLKELPLIKVLEETSKDVFVPLTVGGGIRDYTDDQGVTRKALEVAHAYFRAGADKVSIGSDAVLASLAYYKSDRRKCGDSSIEQISAVYGAQAVIVSVDPRRVYVKSPDDTAHATFRTSCKGPKDEEFCWYQCSIKGGREFLDLSVTELAVACEDLGAGEILLNCIDNDGRSSGFDLELTKQVKEVVKIPVVASSGAGCAEHFKEVFEATDCDAALAAGILHRNIVTVKDIKEHLFTITNIPVRHCG